MHLRGALVWEAEGEPHRDEVVVSDERPNGRDTRPKSVAARVVILDLHGERRASSPADLPPGSVLLLPSDADERDVALVQGSGYSVHRDPDDDGYGETAEDRRVRQEKIAAADAELDEVIARLTREARQRHPELFDANGELRKDELARHMLQRTGGKTHLTDKELIEMTGGDLGPPRGATAAPNAPQAL
jgi:hypothetical protein